MDRTLLETTSFGVERGRLFRLELLACLGLAVVMVGAGCASFGRSGDVSFEPTGPGATFDTIEEAVVDAMAYSVIQARRDASGDRMHGGVITAVDGGYTHAEPVVASALAPHDIRYVIGPHDVARYHVYPKANELRERRAREHVTRWDRASVDEADPLHRPLYFLTPSLVVKSYEGPAVPEQEIARLDEDRGDVNVVMMASSMP